MSKKPTEAQRIKFSKAYENLKFLWWTSVIAIAVVLSLTTLLIHDILNA